LHKACTSGGFGYLELVNELMTAGESLDVNAQNAKGV
jgi:hypothetical protein